MKYSKYFRKTSLKQKGHGETFLKEVFNKKPKSFLEAIGMLKLLSGQTHQVITGICFTCPKTHVQISRTVSTFITFPDLTESSIKKYVYENNPLDKAGGYGIQDVPAHFISYHKGCYFNVMGLPIYALLRLAKQYDIILN